MPAFDKILNWSYSTVLTAPSPPTSGTILVVAAGTGVRFPATPFNAWVWPPSVQPLASNAEIVRVTNVSTDTFTIARLQVGANNEPVGDTYVAKSIAAGWQIAAGATAKTLIDIQNSLNYAADGGSTDAYAITLSPVPTAYVTGQVVLFKANTLNTGAATLNVNSLGAITIKKYYNSDLATGDVLAGQICAVIYDGTNFQLLNPSIDLSGLTAAAWTSFTVTFTNLTTSSKSGKYAKIGRTVHFRITAVPSATPGGSVLVDLPFATATDYAVGSLGSPIGQIRAFSGGGQPHTGEIIWLNATSGSAGVGQASLYLYQRVTSGTFADTIKDVPIDNTFPVGFGSSGDALLITGTFEAAS